jgi:hypothetical protein
MTNDPQVYQSHPMATHRGQAEPRAIRDRGCRQQLGSGAGGQPTEQPSRRTAADADGSQRQLDEDQDHGDQQAATNS